MKLKYIDALRGIAILGVIIVHTGQHGSNEYYDVIKSIIRQGARGVQLFYLASAFTLFLSFRERENTEQRPYTSFYIRRFFRIAPMYYLGILYYLFQNGLGPRYWLGDAEGITNLNILSNFLFVHGINPYWITSLVPGGWSITVEMTFYAIIPFLVNKIKNLNHAILFTSFSLIVSILLNLLLTKNQLISDSRLWKHFLFFYFPNQLAIFGLGIIAYFIIVKNEKKISILNLIILSILLVEFVIFKNLPTHFVYGILFLILIVFLSKIELKLFINKVTVFLGKISYSAYLVHFAVLFWLSKFGLTDLIDVNNEMLGLLNYFVRLAMVLTFTSILSWFFLKTIEIPFQKIGKKLCKKLNSNFIN